MMKKASFALIYSVELPVERLFTSKNFHLWFYLLNFWLLLLTIFLIILDFNDVTLLLLTMVRGMGPALEAFVIIRRKLEVYILVRELSHLLGLI
jgi:hypothetical protein